MSFFAFYPKCPRCSRLDLLRISRQWWMRLVWGSRHLKCPACGESFIFIRPSKITRFIALLILVIVLFVFMRDLNGLIPNDSDRIIRRGFSINDSGQIAGNRYLKGESRALPLTPKSKPTMDAILNFFDQSVKAGTLVGKGFGNSGNDRLNSLRDMLKITGAIIALGNIEDACEQSKAASEKCDNDPSQPDFVSGSAATELCTLILDLMKELECESAIFG